MNPPRPDWPAVNLTGPRIDPQQLAETLNRAQQIINDAAANMARAMRATSVFGRAYNGNPDGARRLLDEMTPDDRAAFRLAALTAYELAQHADTEAGR